MIGACRERAVDVAQVGPYVGILGPEPGRLLEAGAGLRRPSRGPRGQRLAGRELRRRPSEGLQLGKHPGGLLPFPGAQVQDALEETHVVGAAQALGLEGVEQLPGAGVVARVERGHQIVHGRGGCVFPGCAGQAQHQNGQGAAKKDHGSCSGGGDGAGEGGTG